MIKTNIKTTHNHNNTKKIINWSEYNNSLKKRDNLSILISESIIRNRRIVFPKKTGKVGRPKRYSDEDYKTKDIIGFINTSAHVHDNTQLKPLLSQVMNQNGYKVNTVIGDGAYDAHENYKLTKRLGIEFLAPLRKDAVEHLNSFHYQVYDTPGWEERNAVVRHVEEFGLDGWKADVDYGRRSLVENAFYRWKTIFGSNLKSRKTDTQFIEQCLRAKIINKFNRIGLPKYELVS